MPLRNKIRQITRSSLLQKVDSYTYLDGNVDKNGRTDNDIKICKRSFPITRKFVEVKTIKSNRIKFIIQRTCYS